MTQIFKSECMIYTTVSRNKFLLVKFFVGALLMPGQLIETASAAPKKADNKNRPNFLIILADDISWPAFGCMNPAAFTKTPNIDKLAQQGIRFSNFHCSTALCMPVRYELYSGLLPPTSGVRSNDHPTKTFKNVNDYLGGLGYTVGLTGKTHFRATNFFKKVPGFSGGPTDMQPEWSMDGMKEFISNAVTEKKNFCAFICSVNAHYPWTEGDTNNFPPDSVTLMPHMVNTPKTRESMSLYMAEVEDFDKQVGASLQMLKEMNLEDNTVVIVLSEQGMEMPQGKYTVYDFGSRAMCLVRWPGHVAPGVTTPAVSMYCDVVPTLVEIAGGNPPKDIDGRSMLKVLTGKTSEHRKYAYIMYGIRRALAGDTFKLIWTPGAQDYDGPVTRKYIEKNIFTHAWAEWVELAKTDPDAKTKVDRVIKHPEYELYNTKEDPYELANLAGDPNYADVLKTMITDFKAEMSALRDTVKN